MAGTSFYMFWFRFIPEMFSALSVAFLYDRAFVCFLLVWLFIIFPFIRVWGVEIAQTSTATAMSTMACKRA